MVRRNRTRRSRTFCISVLTLGVIALFAVLVVISLIDTQNQGTSRELSGTLVSLYQTQSESPPPPVFLVRLDDGTLIRTGDVSGALFRRGRRVLIVEYQTKILKRKTYQFIRYLDDAHQKPQAE